jgi:hypothetical protein
MLRISICTQRNWEQSWHVPKAPAKVLLKTDRLVGLSTRPEWRWLATGSESVSKNMLFFLWGNCFKHEHSLPNNILEAQPKRQFIGGKIEQK